MSLSRSLFALLFFAISLIGGEPKVRSLAQTPLRFEPNVGQADGGAPYVARGAGFRMLLTGSEAVLAADSGAPVHMRLEGARTPSAIHPQDRLGSITNYYFGNDPKHWHAGVPNYGRVTFEDVYPGIDVVYYGKEQRLEYDLVVAPGADPSAVRWRYSGADSVRLNADGDIVLAVRGHEIRQRRPVIYQEVAGRRRQVRGEYQLADGRARLALGEYDHSAALVIDPPVILYATYLGGSGIEGVGPYDTHVAIDSSGAAYLAGESTGGFPTLNAYQSVAGNSTNNVFAAKFDPSGNLVYSTYLSGAGECEGGGIAVDSTGAAYITGQTAVGFPLMNPTQATYGGGTFDAFIAKLNPTGALAYSTYLGGTGYDMAREIALDSSGNIYAVGSTTGGFPTLNAAQPNFGGGSSDGFAVKLTPAGALTYSTYLGGSGQDLAFSVATDTNGTAYISGATASTDFPTLNPLQATNGSAGGTGIAGANGFVVKLSATGARQYSTYLGGSGGAFASGIAVDATGAMYVAGITGGGFPVVNAAQPVFGGGGEDAFVARLNPAGSALVYATYLGGPGADEAHRIALDPTGAAYIVGIAAASFPVQNAFQSTFGGGTQNALVAELSPSGTVVYASYLGGAGSAGNDQAVGIAVDSTGAAYVSGEAGPGLPTTANAYQPNFAGTLMDAFLAKIGPAAPISTANISSIFPDTAVAGGPAFTLSVFGTGFQSGSTVYWNGSALSTTFVISGLQLDPGYLTAQVPANLIAATGIALVTVGNPGQSSSNAAVFTIVQTPVVPTLTSARVSHTYNCPQGFLFNLLAVNGSGFQSGTTVYWNGTPLPASGTVIATAAGPYTALFPTLYVPPNLLQTSGTVSITASNGGAMSNAVPITNPVPPLIGISSIDPNNSPAGHGGITVTVTGSNFQPGYRVLGCPAGGNVVLPNQQYISSTELQATIPAADMTTAGTFGIWVDNGGNGFASLTNLPFTVAAVDFTQQGTKLIASGAPNAKFQALTEAISANGNTALVGGNLETSISAWPVWVFQRANGAWTQAAQLTGTGFSGSSGFGFGVAISGDGNTAVATQPADNNGVGAAWVFTQSNGVWTQQGPKLVGSGAVGAAGIGSVAISSDGNTILLGGGGDSSNAGAAWVFTRSNGVWTQQGGKLTGTGAVGPAQFGGTLGNAVSLSADGTVAVIGGSADNGGIGAAWIFARSNGVWTQQGSKFVGTGGIGTTQQQGYAVAMASDGSGMAVGAPGDNSNAGAVWGFVLNNGVWAQYGKLTPSDEAGAANFGISLSLGSTGGVLAIGGRNDNNGTGATWIFTGPNTIYQLGSKLVGSNAIGAARQGTGVAVSEDASTLIEGGDVDNTNVGASWVFTISSPNPPAISSLIPVSAAAGGPAFTLTVNASNALPGAAVQWNGTSLATTFVALTQLTAAVPASLIAASGTASITVLNPDGKASTPATSFSIMPPSALGTITENLVPTSNAVPHGITAGPDGALWFAEESPLGNKIGRITTSGVVSEFPIPTTDAGAEDLVTGPDGAVWFSELNPGKIGRITTAGTITEFPLPSSASAPFGIVTGPDGNLWFAEAGAGKIGMMTTTGAVSEFPIPTSGSQPAKIALGPDGAFWFTEAGGNKIGRITLAGTVTEFPVTTPSSGPWGIMAGADGALWFVESSANKIGRITTAGNITEFNIPTGSSGALNMGTGPDGAIWFTESGAGQIGRITTAGTITEFPVPTAGNHAESIVAGRDGGMWFTEGQGNKIGRSGSGLTATPALTITSSHTGSFPSGGQGTYTLTIANTGSGPTNGTVTAVENLPAGMTFASMTGSGWNCSVGIPVGCTRGDSLPAGGSYPPITVTVNVAGSATTPAIPIATVFGGGSTLAGITDSTSLASGPAISIGCGSLNLAAPAGGLTLSQLCTVANPNNLTLTLGFNTTSGGSWLFASIGGGFLGVTVNPFGLAPGTYSGNVTVTPSSGAAATVIVTLTVTPSTTLSPTSNTSVPSILTTASFTVNTTGPWAVVSNNPWITITSPSADSSGNYCSSGSGAVSYTVAANTAPTGRSGSLTILAGCPTTNSGALAEATFEIGQAAQTACNNTAVFPQGQPTSFAFSAAGTNGTPAVVQLNNACSGPTGQPSWITITASSASSFSFTVASYSGTTPRTGTIQVGSQSIAVTQDPPNCFYSLATAPGSSAVFPAAGGQGSMKVATSAQSCPWTATASSSSFITQLSPGSGTGSSTVTFTVPANSQSAAQSGYILIQGLKYNITQAGAGAFTYTCTLSSDPVRIMRAESETELIADLILTCSGISAGGVMGDVIVNLSSNTDITNHALTTDPSHATTDALLLNVDNPNAGWTLTGSTPNAWRGVIAGPRSIRFPSVSLAPAGAFSHTFRITNIRIDASRVASAFTPPVALATAQVVIQPPLASPSAGAPFVVPTTSLAVGAVPVSGSAVQPSTAFAAGSLTPGGPGGSSYWPLTFTEQQMHAFLPAIAAGQSPSTPGVQYVSESGFVNTGAFGVETGFSNNGRWTSAGAAMGSRLIATIANVPCSVALYAPLSPNSSSVAQLVSADSTGSFGFPVVSSATINGAGVDGILPVILTPSNGAATCTTTGSATLTWEINSALANSPSAVSFNVYVSNPGNASLSGVTFSGGLAPLVTASDTSATAPVPRFVPFQAVTNPSPAPLLSFFFDPTGGSNSGNLTSLALASRLPAVAAKPASGPRGKLVPETATGGQCSQTATATVTNEGSVAANGVATVQGSGPLSGCFGPNAQTSGSACSCNTSLPPGGVYQCSAVSTSCTPVTYSGFATSDQGNNDPNNSDTVQPAAPIVTLTASQSPAAFAQNDSTGDDTVTVTVMNTGDDAPPGSISITETLPANSGLTLASITTPPASIGDPYSAYWNCSVTSATSGTCTYGNNASLTPPQQYLLNSSKIPSGHTQFTLVYHTSATANGNVNHTLQLDTNIGGNLNGTTYPETIVVQPGITITTPATGSALPSGTPGATYSYSNFQASGGSGSYTWTATGLPQGLTMSTAGAISGTPNTAGNYTVNVTASDAKTSGVTPGEATYTLAIAQTQALAFYPLTPCRVVDTRGGAPLGGAILSAGSTRSFALPGNCNIPATAQAYSLNVTAVPQTVLGYLTIWPTGSSQPVVSTLNSYNGAIVANAAIVPAGTGGAVSVFATDNTQVILDVNGYFAPPGTGGLAFYPLTPCRVADTRSGSGSFGAPALAAGQTRNFPMLQSNCAIPAAAQAYSLNMTVVPPGPMQYLSTWPAGQTQPVVSTLNSYDGRIVANAAIVPAGTSGAIDAYASDATNLLIDINGYFAAPGSPGALYFYPVTPCRVADTRSGSGNFGAPSLAASSTRTFPMPSSSCGLPQTAKAYSLNMTAVPPGSLLYLSTWPAGQTQPVVSTLNDQLGQIVANAAIVPAGASGGISVFVSDATNLIIDVNGYFGQ